MAIATPIRMVCDLPYELPARNEGYALASRELHRIEFDDQVAAHSQWTLPFHSNDRPFGPGACADYRKTGGLNVPSDLELDAIALAGPRRGDRFDRLEFYGSAAWQDEFGRAGGQGLAEQSMWEHQEHGAH